MRKTFVMLTAPGMIGKSKAARMACQSNDSAVVLDNDNMMHEIFRLVLLNPEAIPIDQMDTWRAKVGSKADCERLIQLLHRDWVSCHREKPIILAEGYTYMRRWYREQVCSGLNCLGYKFDYWLLQYYPSLNEQIKRRMLKYAENGWSQQEPSFHEQELRKQWKNLEPLASDENINFKQVDDVELHNFMSSIVQEHA